MKKIEINTTCNKLRADVYTPVGIYLRVRDRFRDTILLESTDHHAAENSWSFICIHAIGGIEITSLESIEFKLPKQNPERVVIKSVTEVPGLLWEFMQNFNVNKGDSKEAKYAQGLYGYSTYDAVQFFDTIHLTINPSPKERDFPNIPLMRYRLYQYVIAVNHFK